jgi:membrane protease YdiL (CAAX protease family)
MQDYVDYLKAIVFFGLIGAILLLVARAKDFFVLPSWKETKKSPVTLSSLITIFAIYLGMTLLVVPVLIRMLHSFYAIFLDQKMPVAILSWVQLFTLLSIFILFYLYSKAQAPELFKRVWKDWKMPRAKPILMDFLIGAGTWIISFPLVIAIGQLTDMLLYFFFGYENYEQVAVRYLKSALGSPPLLAVALFTILIAAPFIEEFLFRGCLQNYFKRYFAVPKAICLSSLCFALFHFAPSQGIGNISLVLSLFLFALFLGFIYERQASLFASIGLHITFNAVSTFRILFFPE